MLVSARRRQRITHLVGCMLLFSACAKKAPDKSDDKLEDKPGPKAPASDAARCVTGYGAAKGQ